MNYPSGVTQASFDREMERLGSNPRPELKNDADPQALVRLEMSLHPERFMRKSDAGIAFRVLQAIGAIADRRFRDAGKDESEREAAREMWRIAGGLAYKVFDSVPCGWHV